MNPLESFSLEINAKILGYLDNSSLNKFLSTCKDADALRNSTLIGCVSQFLR